MCYSKRSDRERLHGFENAWPMHASVVLWIAYTCHDNHRKSKSFLPQSPLHRHMRDRKPNHCCIFLFDRLVMEVQSTTSCSYVIHSLILRHDSALFMAAKTYTLYGFQITKVWMTVRNISRPRLPSANLRALLLPSPKLWTDIAGV